MTGSLNQLGVEGLVGLFQRMVALGLVALGQTFVILGGSIDLSVGSLISTGAVLASFIMRGQPDLILPAIVAVTLTSAAFGAINGLVIAKLKVSRSSPRWAAA